MTEKEKKIMQTCGALIAHMSELEKEKFLSFTEGMAFLSMTRAPEPRPQK